MERGSHLMVYIIFDNGKIFFIKKSKLSFSEIKFLWNRFFRDFRDFLFRARSKNPDNPEIPRIGIYF